MSKSYRDQRPRNLAVRKLGVMVNDEKPLPRIIVRKPRIGDGHPISCATLRGAIKSEVPLEYLYGLSRIELRARNHEIGSPFGCYLIDEKTIVLYSLPLSLCWDEMMLSPISIDHMRAFNAKITESAAGVKVCWPDEASLAMWFFFDVVCHEFGHHFRNQYKARHGVASYKHEEWIALIHSDRFYNQFLRRISKKRLNKSYDK